METDIKAQKAYNDKVEEFETSLFSAKQPDCPLSHFFGPGVYIRQITMHADDLIVGHEHKTEHFNIVLKGKANVMMGNEIVEVIEAPCIFISKPGVRKVLYILEEMIWATVHVTEETSMDKLEEELIVKSESWKINNKMIQYNNKHLEEEAS